MATPVFCLWAAPGIHAQELPAVTFAPDVRISIGPGEDHRTQVEPSIAASVTDPRKLAILIPTSVSSQGSFSCAVAFSEDAGESWQFTGFVPTTNGCLDPAVASGVDGSFYFTYLTGPGVNVAIARSSDGGRTFSLSGLAVQGAGGLLPDKPYMTVDTRPRSRFRGNIYIPYVAFDFQNGIISIQVVISRDEGITWSSAQTLSRVISSGSGDTLITPIPVVDPDGKVYVFYFDGRLVTGPSSIKFVVSSDGGRRWSAPADAAANLPTPVFFNSKNDDPSFGSLEDAGAVGSGDPTIAITPDGTIFLAWADFPEGQCIDTGGFFPACTNADLRMSVSKDGGKSWTPPVKVTDETNATDQMFPWIAAHPDGLVSVMWLDKRLDPENVDYDIFYTNTRDGTTFLPNVRVSAETSNVGLESFYGDYNNVAVTADGVFPVWCDLRELNNRDVYAAKGTLSP